MDLNKIDMTALEIYIDKLRKEFGENVIKNCSPSDALRQEKEQTMNAYIRGAEEEQDRKLQTLSQYAADDFYRLYKK